MPIFRLLSTKFFAVKFKVKSCMNIIRQTEGK
jgi:hypothetical protein